MKASEDFCFRCVIRPYSTSSVIYFVVSCSKFLSRINRAAMEEGRLVLCSRVPSPLHHSLWPPCIQPDWYLLENLYKRIETWVSSKSWYPKKINLFLAGNKITGMCGEATHQKMCNNVPIHWLGYAFLKDANNKASF